MILFDKFMIMSNDARKAFAERHAKELTVTGRHGASPPMQDDEIITVTREQMIAFGVKYRTTTPTLLAKALEEHPEEAGFTMRQVSFMFQCSNGFYKTVQGQLGILMNGEIVSDEQFFDLLSKHHIYSPAEYKRFKKRPEGKDFPSDVTLLGHYGSLSFLFAALYSRDMNLQFKLYISSSIMRGRPLTKAEGIRLGLEMDELDHLVGIDNLSKIAEDKIRRSKEGEEESFNIEQYFKRKH